LVGGVTGLISLKQASEKVMEANNIVIQTSVQNYNAAGSIGLNTSYNNTALTSALTPLTRLCLPNGHSTND
jgi:hypothetical protein